ncbi:MAG: nucleotidyltransferase family protein [Deltaproteobacteria bacterium]|nr:nucleotidyltransferase family protein [Deltaproteobacteria bacterium]
MAELKLAVDSMRIGEFCRKWRATELAVFGSVLRDDFGPDSDIDVLVTFEADVPWSLFEWLDMIEEMKEIFGRPVDLVDSASLRNPFRRRAILEGKEVLHAA